MIAEATRAGIGGEAGALRGDVGVREMQRRLAQLPTMILSSTGDGPHTLAEIGVRTNRDGTLARRCQAGSQAVARQRSGRGRGAVQPVASTAPARC